MKRRSTSRLERVSSDQDHGDDDLSGDAECIDAATKRHSHNNAMALLCKSCVPKGGEK